MSNDADIFTARVEMRRRELQLENDELLGVLAGALLAVCDELDMNAFELVAKAMEAIARKG